LFVIYFPTITITGRDKLLYSNVTTGRL